MYLHALTENLRNHYSEKKKVVHMHTSLAYEKFSEQYPRRIWGSRSGGYEDVYLQGYNS
jgi:hypothetical protein